MKAIRTFGWAVAAAVIISATATSATFATELAEWLANGSEITSPLKTSAETVSSLLLEDSSTGTEVEITATEKGTAGLLEKGTVETVTVLSFKIVKAGTCGTLESVQAVNLPWTTELYLSGEFFRNRTLSVAEKSPGWLAECLTFGIKVTDTCTGSTSALAENSAEAVRTEFDLTTEEEAGTCTLGGAGTGLVLSGGAILVSAESPELKLSVAGGPAPPPEPRVELVDFDGNSTVLLVDHILNVAEKAIDMKEVTGGGNDTMEWKEPTAGTLTKNWPVVYALADKINILEARFALPAATQVFLETKLGSEVTLDGSVTTGAKTLTFSKKLTQAEVATQMTAHKTYLSINMGESNEELPLVVGLYEGVPIKWKWTVKETGRTNAYDQQAGSSDHNIYVTFKKLVGTESYLTLLDLATSGIAEEPQAPTEAQAIAGVWRGFKHEEEGVPSIFLRIYDPKTGLIERNGLTLKYYAEVTAGLTLEELALSEPARCPFGEGWELLEKAESQCSAWAEIFAYSLGIEGIHSKGVGMRPSLYTAGPCMTVGACIILVKNWEFLAGGGAKPMEEFPYEASELTELSGIAGQGVANPSSWFGGHVIVEAGSTLYDPSYGIAPISGTELLKKYQEATIAGVCSGTRPMYKCQVTPGTLILEETEPFKI